MLPLFYFHDASDMNKSVKLRSIICITNVYKPNFNFIFSAPDCLNFMRNGSELIKVRSNSRQYHRLFTLDDELSEIRWHPSSKKPNKAKSKSYI